MYYYLEGCVDDMRKIMHFSTMHVYVCFNLQPSYISVGMWTAVVLYETSRLKSGSISRSSGIYRFFFFFNSSVLLSCTKGENKQNLEFQNHPAKHFLA